MKKRATSLNDEDLLAVMNLRRQEKLIRTAGAELPVAEGSESSDEDDHTSSKASLDKGSPKKMKESN